MEVAVICTLRRQSRVTAKNALMLSFFFSLSIFSLSLSKIIWGCGEGIVCFGLFVRFFHFITFIVLPHARIEPHYKGKYGVESLCTEGSTAQPCSSLHLYEDVEGPKDNCHASNSQARSKK